MFYVFYATRLIWFEHWIHSTNYPEDKQWMFSSFSYSSSKGVNYYGKKGKPGAGTLLSPWWKYIKFDQQTKEIITMIGGV